MGEGHRLMRNTIILTGILFVAVVVASVFYFAGLDKDEQAKSKLYEQLPADAVWIASFQNDDLLDNVFDGFPIFKALLGYETVRKLNRVRHDLLGAGLGSQTPDAALLLSVHPVPDDSLTYLLSMQLGRNTHTEGLYKAIGSDYGNFGVAWPDSASQAYFALSVPGFSTPLFVTVSDGVTMASPSRALIQRVTDQTHPTLPANTIGYFVKADEENSLLKLHVVQHNLGGLAQHLTNGKGGAYLSLLENIGEQSSLHMNYKSDALIFSGFSEIKAPEHYLSLFVSQSPVSQQIKHLFPANTATYLSFGISDFERFHAGNLALLEQEGQLAQMRDQHRIILDRNGVSIQDDLMPQWGDEFAIIELDTRETLAAFKLRDTMAFKQVIGNISTPYPDSMYRFNNSNLLHYAFGEVVRAFARPYFMIVDDYLVCANHTSTLRQFAQNISSGITLSSTPGYRALDELQGNTGNVSFFVHVDNARRIVSGKLKPKFAKQYNDTTQFGYSDFYAWSVQLSGNGNNFFANLYAPFTDKESPGATPTWTFDLNGRLAATPAVLAYDDTSRFILAQSSNHILHALDFQGQRLWNAQLPGIMLGIPQQLADSSIVLTTETRLYRFDTDGNPLPGFSLELSAQATAGASVIEHDSLLRIFVPTAHALLVYDGSGNLIPDWENKNFEDATLSGVQIVSTHDNTVAIAVATTDGTLYIFDEHGNTIQQHELVSGLESGPTLMALDGNLGSILTMVTDTLGNTHGYTLTGEATRFTVDPIAGPHRLHTANLAGDTQAELVYLEPRSVTMYAYPDSTYAFRYELGQDIDLERVRFFEISQNHHGIGIPTPASGLIYLLRGDGTLMDGFPSEGGPYFHYGRASRGNPAFLLTSKNDRRLYLFQW